ncbi:MAG: hypothetical protein QOE92_1643 [Chloroflexota bacterium]|jgi:hypothetical protein|nr:hypothetical protein [Chloroflexota bacterium]
MAEQPAAERRYPHPLPKDGVGGQVADLVDDVQRLVQLEIDLLKLEMQELAMRNAIAVGLIVGGALSALLFFIFLQVVLVEAIPIPQWITALVITVVWLAAAISLILVGKSRILIQPPEKTIQSLKDDLEWVKAQIALVTK